MKYLICIIIATVIIFTSCDDFLELEDPTKITNTTFWKNVDDAEKGLVAVYSALKQTFLFNMQGIKNLNCRGDDVIARLQNPNIFNPDLFINTPSNSFARKMWEEAYVLIYRANQVIDNVAEIEMNETRKDEIIGEATFLRGIAYFVLVTNFGDVPIVLSTVQSEENLYPLLSSKENVWKQIYTDFSEAKSKLKENVAQSEAGRATKFAASAFLGKAYLYNKEWSKAIAEFEYIQSQGDFDLVADVNDNFTNSNENNVESIFEIQFNYFETSKQITNRAKHFAPPGVGYYVATPSPWIFEEFQKEKTIDGDFDPRMYATFIWNYEGATIYQQPFAEFFSSSLDYIAWKKYQLWDLPKSEASLGRSDRNERMMRFSHVLLMYAEALNELNRTEDAYTPVNRIRERANLPQLNAGLDQQEMRQEIRHQRALEFCFEGERWYDIVRWEIGNHVFAENLDRPNYVKGKHDYFPVPQSELDANPNLIQNSNW